MPEGDAVWRAARRLHDGLAGQVLVDWELRWPSLATSNHRGATTVEVVPRGKHLLHRLDDGFTLHSHLRMDGSWKVLDPATITRRQLANPDLRAVIGTRDATAFGRLLGMLDVIRTEDEHRLVGHLGPDLLGADWDAAAAVERLRRHPDAALGTALLDQRNLAGIGTMWMAEVLWCERLSPWVSVGQLGDDELAAVVDRAHALVTAATAYPFSVDTGNPRDPLFTYGRTGLPCRRCGTRIAVGEVPGGIGRVAMDRMAWHCPRCQPAPEKT